MECLEQTCIEIYTYFVAIRFLGAQVALSLGFIYCLQVLMIFGLSNIEVDYSLELLK